MHTRINSTFTNNRTTMPKRRDQLVAPMPSFARLSLLLTCFAIAGTHSSAFVVHRGLSTHRRTSDKNHAAGTVSSSSPVVLSAGRTWGSNDKKPTTTNRRFEVGRPGKEVLTFDSYYEVISDPLPSDVDLDDIRDFFALDSTRLLLVSAGGRRPAKKLKLTPQLVALWRSACMKYYGDELLPAKGDNVFACDSAIQFPGVKLTMTIAGGVKQLESPHGKPRGEFIIIGTRETAEGPPPLVWFFDQVINKAGGSSDSFALSKAEARVGISVVDAKDKPGHYAFKLDLKSQIRIEVPKLPFGAPKPPSFLTDDTKNTILNTFKPDVQSATKAARASFLKLHPQAAPATEGSTSTA